MARRVSGATSGWVTAAARTSTPADSAAMPTVARPAPTLAPTLARRRRAGARGRRAREAASAAAAAGIARTPTPTKSAAVEACPSLSQTGTFSRSATARMAAGADELARLSPPPRAPSPPPRRGPSPRATPPLPRTARPETRCCFRKPPPGRTCCTRSARLSLQAQVVHEVPAVAFVHLVHRIPGGVEPSDVLQRHGRAADEVRTLLGDGVQPALAHVSRRGVRVLLGALLLPARVAQQATVHVAAEGAEVELVQLAAFGSVHAQVVADTGDGERVLRRGRQAPDDAPVVTKLARGDVQLRLHPHVVQLQVRGRRASSDRLLRSGLRRRADDMAPVVHRGKLRLLRRRREVHRRLYRNAIGPLRDTPGHPHARTSLASGSTTTTAVGARWRLFLSSSEKEGKRELVALAVFGFSPLPRAARSSAIAHDVLFSLL